MNRFIFLLILALMVCYCWLSSVCHGLCKDSLFCPMYYVIWLMESSIMCLHVLKQLMETWLLPPSCIYFFLIFFFLMWTIFKVFIELVILLLLFYALVFWLRGTWDLSSPTRDGTRTACIGRRSLNHWTTREVPWPPSFKRIGFIFKTLKSLLKFNFFPFLFS